MVKTSRCGCTLSTVNIHCHAINCRENAGSIPASASNFLFANCIIRSRLTSFPLSMWLGERERLLAYLLCWNWLMNWADINRSSWCERKKPFLAAMWEERASAYLLACLFMNRQRGLPPFPQNITVPVGGYILGWITVVRASETRWKVRSRLDVENVTFVYYIHGRHENHKIISAIKTE